MKRQSGCSIVRGTVLIVTLGAFSIIPWYTIREEGNPLINKLHKRFIQQGPTSSVVAEPLEPELLFNIHTELFNLKLRLSNQATNENDRKEFQARTSFLLNTVDEITQIRETTQRVEVDELSVKIQNRLQQLQNPDNCETAKKMVCIMENWFGFGGMVHHMAACYNIGLATNRVVLFHYKLGNHYKDVLMNGSKCSVDPATVNRLPLWDGKSASSKKLVAFMIQHKINAGIFPTDALPQDVAPHIQSFHGLPVAWFQGQIVKHIMRPTDQLLLDIEQVEKKINFSTPILGLHIRRTDKHFRYKHADDEYMKVVMTWFDIFNQRRGLKGLKPLKKRRIFLGTDNTETVEALSKGYPGFEFINNSNATKLAENPGKRSEKEGLLGLLVDIHILSKCSHLVCDGNSNVCRLSYELMQTKFVDASTMFTPVGLVYHNFPYLNQFEQLLDFSQQRPVSKVVQLNGLATQLNGKFHTRRLTNIVPVSVL